MVCLSYRYLELHPPSPPLPGPLLLTDGCMSDIVELDVFSLGFVPEVNKCMHVFPRLHCVKVD